MLDKKTATCAVVTIDAFRLQYIRDEKADFAEPCIICPYGKECKHDWISILDPIFEDSEYQIDFRSPVPL